MEPGTKNTELPPTVIYIRQRFLSAAACRLVRDAMDRGASEPAEILRGDIGLDEAVRQASSIDVDAQTLASVEQRLDSERQAIGTFFGLALTAREGAGFLRYAPGGFYRLHRDHGILASWPAAAHRRISIVVFLNDSTDSPAAGEFGGGALRLHDAVPPRDLVPREGLLVAFPATTLHEVLPVRDGTRDAIVDWFY